MFLSPKYLFETLTGHPSIGLIVIPIAILLLYFNPVARSRRQERGKLLLYIPRSSRAMAVAIGVAVIHICAIAWLIYLWLSDSFVEPVWQSRAWQVYSFSLCLLIIILLCNYFYLSCRFYENCILRGDRDYYEYKYITGWKRISDTQVDITANYEQGGERAFTLHHKPAQAGVIDSLLRKKITVEPDL